MSSAFVKQLVRVLNIQISKALCMGINGFFTKNAQPLLSVASKKINNITAEGEVMKEIIADSKTKLEAAVTKIIDSEDFKGALAKKMSDQIRMLNIPIVCTMNGKQLGGVSKTKAYRNVPNTKKKQTKKYRPKKCSKS